MVHTAGQGHGADFFILERKTSKKMHILSSRGVAPQVLAVGVRGLRQSQWRAG